MKRKDNDMNSKIRNYSLAALFSVLLTAGAIQHGFGAVLPDPAAEAAQTGEQSVVLAGGCFWGMQDVYQHVKGVKATTVGYAGGTAETAQYEIVSSGMTGHAESLKIVYDPAQVSFGQLLKVYFQVAHDPTELNRQGPDSGTQYRSEIFFTTPAQEKTASAYIAQLDKAKAFPAPIVTRVEQLQKFYPAEDYHQNYAATHPDNAYILINDAPKVGDLKKELPALYVENKG
jgi:peptide-methionine (S)-S-oxide reductase